MSHWYINEKNWFQKCIEEAEHGVQIDFNIASHDFSKTDFHTHRTLYHETQKLHLTEDEVLMQVAGGPEIYRHRRKTFTDWCSLKINDHYALVRVGTTRTFESIHQFRY